MAYSWLALVCAAVMTSALPLLARAAVCVALATAYGLCAREFIGLKGRNTVWALGWSGDGALVVWRGAQTSPVAATLAAGSFRLGTGILVLTLRTDAGLRALLIHGSMHEEAAFRALCRRLEWHIRRRSGAPET